MTGLNLRIDGARCSRATRHLSPGPDPLYQAIKISVTMKTQQLSGRRVLVEVHRRVWERRSPARPSSKGAEVVVVPAVRSPARTNG